jgi:hypothetical protein
MSSMQDIDQIFMKNFISILMAMYLLPKCSLLTTKLGCSFEMLDLNYKFRISVFIESHMTGMYIKC